jgi:hypothetical protein
VRKRRERKQQAENLLLILALNEGAHSLPPQQLPRRRLIKSFDVVMISQVTHVPDSEPNDSPCVLPTWESRTTAASPPHPKQASSGVPNGACPCHVWFRDTSVPFEALASFSFSLFNNEM